MVRELEIRGEVAFEHLFLDGTKIEANANRYSFVWAKSVSKHEARLDGKLSELLAESERHMVCPVLWQPQRDLELLQGCLRRKAKYADYNAIFKGRDSFSKTDRDATFMRSKAISHGSFIFLSSLLP